MNIRQLSSHAALIIVLLLAFLLRIYGINWDAGYHFHPDERMLIMVTDRIDFFSQLNPDFFNYGSLPVYILAAVAQIGHSITKMPIDTYDGLLPVGRMISLICDLIVIILIYKTTLHLFKKRSAALWASFFYTIAFFPIQNSHFFIVDTFLNLFITFLIYLILLYQNKPRIQLVVLMGMTYAAALTTKVTPVIFAPVIFIVFLLPKTQHKNVFTRIRELFANDRLKKNGGILIKYGVAPMFLFAIVTVLFSFGFMPYAFFESQRFLNDIQLQVRMNSDPYVFPYTLQYIGTIPYLYYLEQIFLWGLGPVLSTLSLMGLCIFTAQGMHNSLSHKSKLTETFSRLLQSPFTFFFLFYLLYFIVIGKSAVKFMRYMLLMYPFFAVMAGYGAYVIIDLYKPRNGFFTKASHLPKLVLTISFVCFSLLWTWPFLNIYSTKSTRIAATEWINDTVPAGSTIAIEHWDDRVPIYDYGKYHYEELTLYDIPDNDFKWRILNQKLERSDYIVIASNRLYIPLQRLKECGEHGRCYPMTGQYYSQLFANERGFVKVAEFTSYPRLQIGHWQLQIIDDHADESFTVYDHPKIIVFKKI